MEDPREESSRLNEQINRCADSLTIQLTNCFDLSFLIGYRSGVIQIKTSLSRFRVNRRQSSVVIESIPRHQRLKGWRKNTAKVAPIEPAVQSNGSPVLQRCRPTDSQPNSRRPNPTIHL
jgi:hypothetical protein